MEQVEAHHAILIDPAKRNISYVPGATIQMMKENPHLTAEGVKVRTLSQLIVYNCTGYHDFVTAYAGMPSIEGVDCHVFLDAGSVEKYPLTDYILYHDHGPERIHGPTVMLQAFKTNSKDPPGCDLFVRQLLSLPSRIVWLCPDDQTRYYCEFFMARTKDSAGALVKYWPVELGRLLEDDMKSLLQLEAKQLAVIPQTVKALLFAPVTQSNLRFARTLAVRAIKILAEKMNVTPEQIIEVSSLT